MVQTRYSFTPPGNAALRWLTDPGRDVSPQVGALLLGEIFASPKAVLAGIFNGLVLNAVALCMHKGQVFAAFIVVDVLLSTLRITVVNRAITAAARGLPTPTGLYCATALGWCALQGVMAFTAMRTSNLPLQLLTATTVMGLVGPICARNYAAPRYAIALVALCTVPFVAGAALSGSFWLLLLLFQCPVFLFGVSGIVRRLQAMAVITLQAEQDSYNRARHDPLTGLLNRFGLTERLDGSRANASRRFILFYLDLDGFKPVNDTFGHQAGDRILQAVAERLRTCVRARDIVSRLGGDEFVIVAPDMLPSQGAAYADTVIRSIADEAYKLNDTDSIRIGISIGFACAPEDGVEEVDLHRKADFALYQAKAAGRGVQRRYTTDTKEAAGPLVFDGCQAGCQSRAA